MEADWAVEIGAGLDRVALARIEADWPGWIDLRGHPERAGEIAEREALRIALLELNGGVSPVFTSKCDVWLLSAEEIDPLEFDAERGIRLVGVASYLDVIAKDAGMLASFAQNEGWARRSALDLRSAEVRSCRVDLVVRAAEFQGREGFGITLYAAGCGADSLAAETAWAAALRGAVTATMKAAAAVAA